MKLIELYLNQLQTEKLDINEFIKKSNYLFGVTYQDVVEDCFSRQKRAEYANPYADQMCEQKAQLAAYKLLFSKYNVWINHCKDQNCKNRITLERRKTQNKIKMLQSEIGEG